MQRTFRGSRPRRAVLALLPALLLCLTLLPGTPGSPPAYSAPDAQCTTQPVLCDANLWARLKRDAISLWRFESGSSLGLDSKGLNTLTNNNAVSQIAGRVGQAAQFVAASSQYLGRADNASLSTGNIAFTLAGWVNLTDRATTYAIANKLDSSGAGEWNLTYTGGGTERFRFRTFLSGAGVGDATANSFGQATSGVWTHVVFWHDPATTTVNIQVNGGPVDSATTTGAPADTGVSFQLGATATPGGFLNGSLDEWGFWKRLLTPAERVWLYNGGSGHPLSMLREPVLLAALVERLRRAA